MPEKRTPLEKRIKRHLLSKDHLFLAVVQPAFRGCCREELDAEGFKTAGDVDGGVEFSGRLAEGWRANLVLRIPSRIYCRLASFRAGSREELFRKAGALPWDLWLPPEILRRIEASIFRSRLSHEGEAAETLEQAIVRSFGEASGQRTPVPRDSGDKFPIQRILLRLEENRCTLSLDMSGEPLYNRGWRLEPAEAPLRESLGAALLREAGWPGEGLFVDGMGGSGTFAVEAALAAAGLPSGGGRSFLFERWPSLKKEAWAYLRRTVREAAAAFPAEAGPRILSNDASASAVAAAARNARRAGVYERILFKEGDFFDLSARTAADLLGSEPADSRGGLVVLNPPYGLRLDEGGPDLYPRLGAHLGKNFRGWKALVLFPSEEALAGFDRRPCKRRSFRHGGLTIVAGFFEL